MADRPIYIDIDGTLTTEPRKMWGPPVFSRIAKVQELIKSGAQVVLWSGGGTQYASDFAARYDLSGATCLGKPEFVIDDNPDIRPRHVMKVWDPVEYFDVRRGP